MSMWIRSKKPKALLATKLHFLGIFPLTQSIQWSKSEKSKGPMIPSLTKDFSLFWAHAPIAYATTLRNFLLTRARFDPTDVESAQNIKQAYENHVATTDINHQPSVQVQLSHYHDIYKRVHYQKRHDIQKYQVLKQIPSSFKSWNIDNIMKLQTKTSVQS